MTDERNPAEADLARLADGSLPGSRQAELRARVAQSPELAAALAEQQRAVSMLRALDQPAPPALRARVDELTGANGARARRLAIRRRRPFVLPGVTALAIAVAVVVVLIGGGSAAPTVPQAARLALASATMPAPAVDATDPTRLDISGAGIPFPNWAYPKGGWQAAGARADTVGGRRVTTVFYRNPAGTVIGYAITSGAALSGAHGSTVRMGGMTFTQQRLGSAALITWVRDGHTCIVAGTAVSYRQLLAVVNADGQEATSAQASLHRTPARAAWL